MNTFKKFISYYSPYKKVFAIDMFCASVVSISDLSIAFVTSHIISNIFSMDDKTLLYDSVLQYVAILAIIYITRTAANYYINYYGHVMGAKMETDMRRDLFSHLEKLSFSYYDRNNTGVMMSKIMTDLFDVTELAHHGPEDIFISILKLVGSFIILANINFKLTGIIFIILIIMFTFMFQINKKMKLAFMDNRKKIASVNASVQDSLSGIRVVKSFSNEEIELEKFQEGNQRFLVSKTFAYKWMGAYATLGAFFQGIIYIAVFFFSAYFAKEGTMEPKFVVTYVMFINMFLEPVNRIINFTEMFQKGFTGFQRMFDVLNTKPDIVDKKEAIEVGKLKGNIEFKNVFFQYEDDDEIILNNININIEHGKTFALVGPSGSGKTTFCSLIPRFYDVTSGSILIDNINIQDMELKSLRSNVGIVQQDVYIFNSTIKENIAYGKPDATFEKIIEAAKKANIHNFIESLEDGYDTLVGERGVRFSGGQKQRISIARVFLKNPPILILDEATSALDNESERYIQQSLEELSKDRTTLVIAHRLSTVKNADKIIVLTEDGVEEVGDHKQLMDKEGTYSKLYNMQFDDM